MMDSDDYLATDRIYVYDDIIHEFSREDKRRIHKLARSITKGNALKDVYRLSSWVSNILWRVTPTYIPPHLLPAVGGDCYNHSILFAALARSLGIPTRFIEEVSRVPESFTAEFDADLKTYGRNFTFHIWNEVYVNGKWIPVDPTEDFIGKKDFESYFKNPKYFKIKVVRRDSGGDATSEYVLDQLERYSRESGNETLFQEIKDKFKLLGTNDNVLFFCRELYEGKEEEIESIYRLLLDFRKRMIQFLIGFKGFIDIDVLNTWLSYQWDYRIIKGQREFMMVTDDVIRNDKRLWENFVRNGGSLLIILTGHLKFLDISASMGNAPFRPVEGEVSTPFGEFYSINLKIPISLDKGGFKLSKRDGDIIFAEIGEHGKGRYALINYSLLMPYRDHRALMKRFLNYLSEPFTRHP